MRRGLVYFAPTLGAAAIASLFLGDFRAGQLSLFLSLAVLAVSLGLVWGYAGILSLGQLLPFGLAAYLTARITTAHPSLSVAALVASAAAGAAISAIVAVVAFRRRLALVVVGLLTLMLSLTFEQIAQQWRDVTGGFNGLTNVPRLGAFGSTLSETWQNFTITVAAVVIIGGVALLLSRPIGAVLVGIRDNERRTEALGYNTIAIKIWVFSVGGAVAGVAGALYVHRTGFVSPGIFGFTLATNVVLWTLIGGRSLVVGPVVGTLLINFASAALADVWLQYWVLATGVIFVAAVLFVPDGLVPSVVRVAGRASRRRRLPQIRERGEIPGEQAGDAVMEADAIDKSFGSFNALKDVSLQIDAAELRCLIGPNGAGKSTLLDILSGQQQHQGGAVALFGQDYTGNPAWEFARRGVSRKFQAPQIIQSLSVAENIALAAWAIHPSPWELTRSPWVADVSTGALQVLNSTGLADRHATPAGDLSHGEKQWLEIAMALAGTCRVLLLDEPTAGMTAAESIRAATLLRELHTRFSLPILIVEHDMAFIRAVADRVTVLARGRLLADGTVAEIEANRDVRAVYLGVEG
ncbi:MAG: branched-chain amino acid ABC transporter ATP-binding protein/permease [Acidobacteria bacterium]|nr:branched-chain amino acid ABC transporter ATP-binding protein/permease [Acidobacteriota bacterium]